MKHFLPLLLLLLTLLPQTANAVKKIEANPINIAAVLVEKTDSAKVASTLEFYGYTFQTEEDGYTVMKHSNGNEIRYSFNPAETKYPTVIVKTKGTRKSIDAKLKELDFEKSGNGYEKIRNQNSRYKTQCNFGSHSTILFLRTRNE